MDEKKIASTLLIDQKSAYDVMSHEILLTKLGEYNFGEDVLMLLRSYLTNRRQAVPSEQYISRDAPRVQF